jgi:nicotinate-nucleotide adenylyltransferase
MAERRIAAYGGTFDPIHLGHVEVVRAVVRNFDIDQLLIIPAHRPPHKGTREIADGYHRFAMAALASIDEPSVIVSTVELETPDRPYTYETVERLKGIFEQGVRLFFVMGADSFEEINTWREPRRLISSTNLIVVTRPGHKMAVSHIDERFRGTIVDLSARESGRPTAEELEGQHIYLTGYVNNELSSTEIRQRVRDGRSIDAMVPPHVADYITKYQLYRQ